MKYLVLLFLFILASCQNKENKLAVIEHFGQTDTVPYLTTEKDSGIIYRIIPGVSNIESFEIDTDENFYYKYPVHDDELELFILSDTQLKKYFLVISECVGHKNCLESEELANIPVKTNKTGIEAKTVISDTIYDIKIDEKAFTPEGHNFSYYKEYKYAIEKIDGRPFYGKDGGMPDRIISSFTVKINNRPVHIPDSAFNDLYQPNLYSGEDFSPLNIFIDRKATYLIIEQWGSDAAGGYTVYWIFKNGVYLGRQMLDFC